MKKIIKPTLIVLITLAFLYLGSSLLFMPLDELDNLILKAVIRIFGITWLLFGIWSTINFKRIIKGT